jgi:hypothetical protein
MSPSNPQGKGENDMTNAPKNAVVTAAPALDEDLELDQPATDAVAGGRKSHTKTKVGD